MKVFVAHGFYDYEQEAPVAVFDEMKRLVAELVLRGYTPAKKRDGDVWRGRNRKGEPKEVTVFELEMNNPDDLGRGRA